MGPSHERQSQLLALELENKAWAWILGAARVKSPSATQEEVGLLKFLILWSAQGTRSGRSGLILRKNPPLFGQLPRSLHIARDTGRVPSERIPPAVLILIEMHQGGGGGIKRQA